VLTRRKGTAKGCGEEGPVGNGGGTKGVQVEGEGVPHRLGISRGGAGGSNRGGKIEREGRSVGKDMWGNIPHKSGVPLEVEGRERKGRPCGTAGSGQEEKGKEDDRRGGVALQGRIAKRGGTRNCGGSSGRRSNVGKGGSSARSWIAER
jgi:hypothetical protein